MFDQLLQAFGQSPQGQNAFQQLQAQGYSAQQSTGILSAALPAAAQAMHRGMTGQGPGPQPGHTGASPFAGITDIGSSHFAQNFLSAAVSGLFRGQGVMNSAVDGLQGVVGGHVSEVIASRFGLPRGVAGVAGAVVTPMMVDFLTQKFQSGGLSNLLSGVMGSSPGGAGGMAGAFGGAAAAFGGAAGTFGGGPQSFGGNSSPNPYRGSW